MGATKGKAKRFASKYGDVFPLKGLNRHVVAMYSGIIKTGTLGSPVVTPKHLMTLLISTTIAYAYNAFPVSE
jgi:hypothetical protein